MFLKLFTSERRFYFYLFFLNSERFGILDVLHDRVFPPFQLSFLNFSNILLNVVVKLFRFCFHQFMSFFDAFFLLFFFVFAFLLSKTNLRFNFVSGRKFQKGRWFSRLQILKAWKVKTRTLNKNIIYSNINVLKLNINSVNDNDAKWRNDSIANEII